MKTGPQHDYNHLTTLQAKEILDFWSEEENAVELQHAYSVVESGSDNDHDLAWAFDVVHRYEIAAAVLTERPDESQAVHQAVLDKLHKACELASVPKFDFPVAEALVVLVRVQTTINQVWMQLIEQDSTTKADEIVSEVRDVLLEAAEEFAVA